MTKFKWFMSFYQQTSSLFLTILNGHFDVEFTNLKIFNSFNLQEVGLTEEIIKKAFYLDVGFGKKHNKFVSTFLKTFLKEKNLKGLHVHIISKIVKLIQERDFDCILFHSRKVYVNFHEKIVGIDVLKDTLTFLYSLILQFSPTKVEKFKLSFDKFDVKVELLNKKCEDLVLVEGKSFDQEHSKINNIGEVPTFSQENRTDTSPIEDFSTNHPNVAPTNKESNLQKKHTSAEILTEEEIKKALIDNLKVTMKEFEGCFYFIYNQLHEILKMDDLREYYTIKEQHLKIVLEFIATTGLSKMFSIQEKNLK